MRDFAIVADAKICKFTVHHVPDRPGIAAELFGHLGTAGIAVHMMAASGAELGRTDISLTVSADDVASTSAVLDTCKSELDAQAVSKRTDVASISLVADGLSRIPGVAGRMFRTLSSQGINIDMISAANTSVTCLIDLRFLEQARQAMAAEFERELAGI